MEDKQAIRDRIAQLQYLRKEKKDLELKLFYFVPLLLSIFIILVASETKSLVESHRNLLWTIVIGIILMITVLYLGFYNNAEDEELRIRNNYKKLNER